MLFSKEWLAGRQSIENIRNSTSPKPIDSRDHSARELVSQDAQQIHPPPLPGRSDM